MTEPKVNQLALYRLEQKRKYEQKIREKYLHDKYQMMIEFDPIKRSASRLVNAVRKHILIQPINTEVLNTVPGRYRLRLGMTELNTFPLEIQNEIFRSATQGCDFNTSKAIIQSLKDSYSILYYAVIDLRIYGPCPEMGISIMDGSQILYLNDDQINKIKVIWMKIDPETSNGVKFNQMLDSAKSLSVLYSLSITR